MQQLLLEPHDLGVEEAGIHRPGRTPENRLEVHLGENVSLEIYPRRDLDQLEVVSRQLEDASLGDVEDLFSGGRGERTAEGALLDLRDELGLRRSVIDDKPTIVHLGPTACGEGTQEDQKLGVLADIDESA